LKVFFSSWNDVLIDNRSLNADSWQEASDLKLPTEFEKENDVLAFMGWSGIILLKKGANIVDMCLHYAAKAQEESCGKCFPCRVGTAVIRSVLERIVAGQGAENDIALIENLAQNMLSSSKCSIGKTSPVPILHALTYFMEEFISAVKNKKDISSSQRYESKATAPCYSACPTGMDVPSYIESIKELKPLSALNRIRSASPMAASLGRACFHPCEKKCRRQNVDNPISICKLKRFAWDYENFHVLSKPVNPIKHSKNEKVAVIGAGPSGLTAAYYLALRGYPVTIFEALPVPGGMVGVGIPEYRVPKEILQAEADFISAMGVDIRYNVKVGTDVTIPQLKTEGYKAFFVSTGAHLSIKIGVEGEDANYSGFIRGIDYLKDCVLDQNYDVTGKKVIVVGGGNVAMDCCRTPIRMGAKEVTIVYRRTKKELPADPHEIHDSEIEGVKYQFLSAPKRIIAEDGKVTGMECFRMELGKPDASGRRRPVVVEGSEFFIPADIIIQAIGQTCDLSILKDVEGISTTKWQTISANPDTFQTDVSDIFTGGDVFNGPLTIVDACGNARRAAESIDQYLSGKEVNVSISEKLDKFIKKLGVYNELEKVGKVGGCERVEMPMISIDERVSGFKEVELGYAFDQAVEEAARCLRCYQIGMVALE
jgi:formate dehydrogenase (NADP+) beta subunit